MRVFKFIECVPNIKLGIIPTPDKLRVSPDGKLENLSSDACMLNPLVPAPTRLPKRFMGFWVMVNVAFPRM